MRYLAVAALLAAIIVARRPDALTNPQFWAEDGYIFFAENLTLGFPHALAKLYRDFPYLTHRLIAFAGGLLPFVWAPRVYTTSAIAITALGLASFALPAFRHLVRSDMLRVLFGVAVVCAPFDWEVFGTVTNLGWFLGVFLSLLSLARLPSAPGAVALLTGLGVALVLSTPAAPVNLPLWLLRAWHAARRSLRSELVFSLVLIGALIAVLAATAGGGAQAGVTPSERGVALLRAPGLFVRAVLDVTFYTPASYVLPPAVMQQLEAVGAPVIAAISVVVVVVWLALCAWGRFRTLPALLAATGLFQVYLVVLLLGRPKLFVLFSASRSWSRVPDRYTIFPAAMFALAMVAALDGIPSARWRHAIAAACALLFVWSWSPTFVVRPFHDTDWPAWAARLERKLATGSPAPLVIPANPPNAPIRFDAPIMRNARVPTQAVLGSLGADGAFSQEFVSRCDGLAGIELVLAAAAPSTHGVLRLTLLDAAGVVLRRQEIPRSELAVDGSLQGFYFDPITGSADTRFTFVLDALQTDPGAAVQVRGARRDVYPGGDAAFSARGIVGDASFRYGCLSPTP